jgi:CBS domain-containing protein
MSKQWKYEERTVAKMFNTTRALMTGTSEKCDIDDPIFAVDTKLRQTWSVEKWFDELQTYARKHDKIALLCLRKPGKKKRLAVIDFDNLVSILKGKGLIPDKTGEIG